MKTVNGKKSDKRQADLQLAQAPSSLELGDKEELVLEYRIKARKLGRSILRRWHARLDLQEVDSIVDLSLCEAVVRFDPAKGASFMTFLYYHLKGNLIRAVSAAAQANFVPTHESDGVGVEESTSISALEVVEAVTGVGEKLPDEILLQKQLVDLSKIACTKLDPLEQQVIERLYLQGEQLMVIARSLGYSRCHISRVKKKALETLQVELDKALASPAETISPYEFTSLSATAEAPAGLGLSAHSRPRRVKRRKRSTTDRRELRVAA